MQSKGYREDLAYIHDVGFGASAREAAPGLLAILRRHGFFRGLVVDLGCGSGIWARSLTDAGFDVLGIDYSSSMIRSSRRRAPRGKFVVGSLFSASLPRCRVVTALGECFNYRFDETNRGNALVRLFHRVYEALDPGGLFIFDLATPERRPQLSKTHFEGRDWAVLVQVTSGPGRNSMTRRITAFRKVSNLYRRTHEDHCLRLYSRPEIARWLRSAGFQPSVLRGYRRKPFPKGITGFLARKPL